MLGSQLEETLDLGEVSHFGVEDELVLRCVLLHHRRESTTNSPNYEKDTERRDRRSLHVKHPIPDLIWMEIMVTSALTLTRRKFDHVLEPTITLLYAT